ncbi:MAG: glutathione ABC transporter permease, partial [Deltaproteobacteria bacterium]|nr:glutathione ABC transporter permease [Deltaproteobacteria bacterium]
MKIEKRPRGLWRELRQNRAALWSLGFILILGLSSSLAPLVSPYGAGGLDEAHILENPSLDHWMGTDGLGRDLFTRVLYGARVSLAV